MRDPANSQTPYVVTLERRQVLAPPPPDAATTLASTSEEAEGGGAVTGAAQGRESRERESMLTGKTALARELMGPP